MKHKNPKPLAVIIAGPNGAGKSTMAPAIMQADERIGAFVNADLIARNISPIHPEKAAVAASRLMLTRLKELIQNRENFLLESTLSGRTYVNLFRQLRENGYRMSCILSGSTRPILPSRV